jgi:cystathionine beta-lyase/cystathionine gamma-synthase
VSKKSGKKKAKKRGTVADSKKDLRQRSMRSFMVHGRARTGKWDFSHHVVPPLSSSSTYRLDSAERGAAGFCGFTDPSTHSFQRTPIYIYDRLDEPTRSMLEDQLAVVEGGAMGVAFATGMGAISAAIGMLVKRGDRVVAHQTLYGCTYSLLTNWMPRFGVETRYVNMLEPPRMERAITARTRVVYFETPVNPTMELIDIQDICSRVKRINAKRRPEDRVHVIVDNTFASPACQRPLQFGVDLVVHSLTKNLCGFGTDMGGVVIGPLRYESDLLLFRKDFGAALSSKSAWPILVYGLPSLDIRMRQEQANARRVADYLAGHPKVARVVYPGRDDFPQLDLARRQMRDFDGNFAPGNMICFVLKGRGNRSTQRATRLIDHVAKNAYAITLAVSLGQIRTLIEMPSSMTHAVVPDETKKEGHIDPGAVRLAIGVEDPGDIIRDLKEALDHA